MIPHISAVSLVSTDPDRLAQFYNDIMGLPLKKDIHVGSVIHHGCEIGDLHFAIHALHKERENSSIGTGTVKLAFEIFQMDKFVAKLKSHGISLLYPPRQQKFMTMTAIEDPDGNVVEITEMSDAWYEHLANRRNKGLDALGQWEMKNVELQS